MSVSPRARARLAYVVFFAGIGALIPYPVLYYEEIGLDLGEIGLIFSFGAVVSLVAGPIWGAISDRFRGSPWVLVAAASFGAAGSLGIILGRDLGPILVAVAALSIGGAGITPILDARALETSGPDRSGYAPLRAFGSLSFVVSTILTGIVVERFGVESALVVAAAGAAATGVVGLTLRPAEIRPSGAGQLLATARLFAAPRLGLFLVGASLAGVGLSAILGFHSLRMSELGGPPWAAGLAFAVGSAVEVPLMFWFATLARRFGGERLLVLGAAMIAVRSLIVGLATDPSVLIAASALHGVGVAFLLVGGVGFVSRVAPPELAATVQGVYQSGTNSFAQIVAGVVGGSVASVYGLSGLYLAVAGVCGVAAVVVAAAVRLGSTAAAERPSPAGASG